MSCERKPCYDEYDVFQVDQMATDGCPISEPVIEKGARIPGKVNSSKPAVIQPKPEHAK